MTRSWIHFTRGRFVRQARGEPGALREEHLSRHGFAGPVAMLYRTDGPNEVVRIEGDYRPRQIDSADIVAADYDGPARRAADPAVQRGRLDRDQPPSASDALLLSQHRW